MPERIGSATMMVMQIDSFVAAGFIVGFFQFQGEMSNKIREAKQLRKRMGSRFPREKRPSIFDRDRLRYFAARKFWLVMLSLVLFVTSGLFAVNGVLYETRFYLVASLACLFWGVTWMMVMWRLIIGGAEELAEFLGEHSMAT